VPNRDEREGFHHRFREKYWEVLAKHLLYVHECITKLKVVHEEEPMIGADPSLLLLSIH